MAWNCQERPPDALLDAPGLSALDSEHLPSSPLTPRKGDEGEGGGFEW